MAYYLTIKNKNEYKLLDISLAEEFQRLSNYKNSYSLQEIDLFTSKFADEKALKTRLFEQGVISIEDITKEISIRMKNAGKLEKVMYDPIYSESSRFLNEEYLRGQLLSLHSNREFLNKLLNHYSGNYHKEFLAEIRERLNSYMENSIKMYNAVDAFFTDEVYDVDYKTGLVKLKYKSLHDLAMFIYNYLNEQKIYLEKINRQRYLKELQQSLNTKEIKEKPVVYVRTKKKYDLDGQSSLF